QPGRERRGRRRLFGLPAGRAAAQAEDGAAGLSPGAHPEGGVPGRALAFAQRWRRRRPPASGGRLMRKLELKDLWPLPVYEGVRHQFRREVIAAKQARRVTVGPFMTFVFENRLTVKFQIQEILRAERVTEDAQVRAELAGFHETLPGGGPAAWARAPAPKRAPRSSRRLPASRSRKTFSRRPPDEPPQEGPGSGCPGGRVRGALPVERLVGDAPEAGHLRGAGRLARASQ